jgi:hypothetical protein
MDRKSHKYLIAVQDLRIKGDQSYHLDLPESHAGMKYLG